MEYEFKDRNPQRSIGPQANPDNYYVGKPCIKCGCTVRLKSKNACVPCKGEAARKYYQKNRTEILEKFKQQRK